MSPRRALILVTITIFLGLQFVVPAVQFFEEGANRWGWQMYSRMNPNPDIVLVTEEGERFEVNLSDHLFHRRAEIRVDDLLLQQLCERIPDAREFELEHDSTSEVEVYQCSD